MLATLTYVADNATDLGFLVHKHPARLQSFEISVGQAHVFYPEATDERCTVALLLEIDPIALARSRRFGGSDASTLGHYVNDRPYASSSMLAVAIGTVFRTAMTGRSNDRPELAAANLPLDFSIAAVPCSGGAELVARLFEPLGWQVDATLVPLDPEFPEWGDSRYLNLRLRGQLRLGDALRQLYVLLPVLDDAKHYWVSDEEVGKLMRAGEGWLTGHPERDLITRRYLKHQKSLVLDAAAVLAELDGGVASLPQSSDAPLILEPSEEPPPTPLYEARANSVMTALRDVGAKRVADLGCGEGALLRRLVADQAFTEITGTDVSARYLQAAAERLKLRDVSDSQRERIRLLQSSVTYEDDRIAGLDALILMEVIEHIEPSRLPAVEGSVFGAARPGAVIVTTPNSEYNELYPALSAGTMRHPDHRFEWSRGEFAQWAQAVGSKYGYTVEFRGIGDVDDKRGSPTQLALFRREVTA